MVTVSLARAWTGQGLSIAVFKKGPDYIDAAWLSVAAGRRARNLDTFLSGPKAVKRSFIEHAVSDGVNLIEGNRGLHDGMDVEGTHSSAALSKLIRSPVIVVQNVAKTTRSAAAFILGSRMLDGAVDLRGVVLNRVGGTRHEGIVRSAIEKYCGIPVFGALPRMPGELEILSRHLGLITPQEETRALERIDALGAVAKQYLDLPALLDAARSAPVLEPDDSDPLPAAPVKESARATICCLRDSAFSFYYPENLEALEAEGSEIIFASPLEDETLPPCDALYVGGGFPETHAVRLARNRTFRESLFAAAKAGLPVYAECGGLIYLAESLSWKGEEFPMTGVFQVKARMEASPQGHGYARFQVDGDNPFFARRAEIRAHEFHYSSIDPGALRSVFKVQRGVGCGGGRDGLLRWNCLGTYFHVHALGCPEWARGIVNAARRYRKD